MACVGWLGGGGDVGEWAGGGLGDGLHEGKQGQAGRELYWLACRLACKAYCKGVVKISELSHLSERVFEFCDKSGLEEC